MNADIGISFVKLRLPLKSTIRHAAASRKEGESIWVEARRGPISGFGEGCPRNYVTGETLESCYAWLEQQRPIIQNYCRTFEQLKTWQIENEKLIDMSPSAWCAVECALLDLFSREQGCNVETLFGLKGPLGQYSYTGVLTDLKDWRFTFTVDYYLTRGLTDFKVKLTGDLTKDQNKLKRLVQLCREHGLANPRIRLDANNLWSGRPEAALAHLRHLNVPFFAIEEPVGPREVEALSQISLALKCPIILDESLCYLRDLERFDKAPGTFIANLKVSKVGGIGRGLVLIQALRKRGWPIIIGAHVGETSLLTRAGLLFAQAAKDALLAHEGAFGSYLLEWDPAEPDLKFGRAGRLDLARPYFERTIKGLRVVTEENWKKGWGLNCCMPPAPDNSARILKYRMSADYDIHYRLWGPDNGDDVLVILHGGMSHSGWQYSLAQILREKDSRISVLAPDRRGCGLNAGRGELGTTGLLIQDLCDHLTHLKQSFQRIHLLGWCQGAQFASIAAANLQPHNILSSLILMTPGLFWNDRFRSVIDIAEKTMFSVRSSFKVEPERENAFVPIPMHPTDFTFVPEWLAFIHEDPLKITKITMKSAVIMDEIQEMSWSAILNVRIPILTIFATNDRIVDNRKGAEYLTPLIQACPQSKMVSMESAHAIHFEKPHELTEHILTFIKKT